MNKTVLISLTIDDLQTLIIDCVNTCLKINKQEQNTTEKSDELLTREEVLDLLQIDSSTLWRYQNDGKIKAYGIGNRRYYKKAEIIDALKPLKK